MSVVEIAEQDVSDRVVALYGHDWPQIIEGFRSGRMHAYRGCGDGWSMEWVEWVDGRELVIACAAGEGVRAWAEYLIQRVRQDKRLRSIRFSTRRPSLGRLLSQTLSCGVEYMYRWIDGRS